VHLIQGFVISRDVLQRVIGIDDVEGRVRKVQLGRIA